IARYSGENITTLVMVTDSRWEVPVMVKGKQSIGISPGQKTVIVAFWATSWLPVNRRTLGEKVTVTPGGIAPAVRATSSKPEPARPTVVTLDTRVPAGVEEVGPIGSADMSMSVDIAWVAPVEASQQRPTRRGSNFFIITYNCQCSPP